MILNPETQARAMLAEALTRLIDGEKTTVYQLAAVAGIDGRTVRRYLAAEYEIPDEVLKVWASTICVDGSVRHVCSEALRFRRDQLVGDLAEIAPTARELDVNRDGRTDQRDAFVFSDQEAMLSVESNRTLRLALDDGVLSAEERGNIVAIEAQKHHAVSCRMAVLEQMTNTSSPSCAASVTHAGAARKGGGL